MNNEGPQSPLIAFDQVKRHLPISIEPDIHLSEYEQRALDRCLRRFYQICQRPLVLNCTLQMINADRESIRLNQYLRVRQPRKYFWMRNIKNMSLHIRLPVTRDDRLAANLIEFHSCKRVPHSSRMIVEQRKPLALVYSIETQALQLNIRGENSLLQLFFCASKSEQRHGQGIYYKWSDEGHIRSTTIQFQIEYSIDNDEINVDSISEREKEQ